MTANNEKNIPARQAKKSWFRTLFWWARVLITGGLAWYLINQIRAEVGQLKLQLTQPFSLLLSFAVVLIGVFCSVWVWRLMLPVDGRPSFLTLLAHYLLGLFYNNFLPGGVGGDVVRTGALVQGGQRIEQAANSVLMARLLGLWSIVLLACVTTPLYAWVIGWQTAFPLMVTVLSAFIIAVLGTAILFGAPMTVLVNHLPARWSAWHCQLRAYREKRRLLIAALGLSFLIQILAVTTNTFVARALGLSISFPALLLSIPLVNLVVLLPISIGGFGVREGVYYYLLEFFGVTAGEAVLLSLTVYFVLALVSAVGAAVSQIWVPKRVEEEMCVS